MPKPKMSHNVMKEIVEFFIERIKVCLLSHDGVLSENLHNLIAILRVIGATEKEYDLVAQFILDTNLKGSLRFNLFVKDLVVLGVCPKVSEKMKQNLAEAGYLIET